MLYCIARGSLLTIGLSLSFHMVENQYNLRSILGDYSFNSYTQIIFKAMGFGDCAAYQGFTSIDKSQLNVDPSTGVLAPCTLWGHCPVAAVVSLPFVNRWDIAHSTRPVAASGPSREQWLYGSMQQVAHGACVLASLAVPRPKGGPTAACGVVGDSYTRQ